MIEGSPTWQTAALLIALSLFLLGIWSGWREGIIRKFLEIIALFISCAAGWFAMDFFWSHLNAWLPDHVHLGLVIPVILVLSGIIAWCILHFIIRIIFRKTSDLESGFMRFIFGIGGVGLGVIEVACLLWIIVSFIRFESVLAKTQYEYAASKKPLEEVASSVQWWLRLQASLELGRGKQILERIALFPEATYALYGRSLLTLETLRAIAPVLAKSESRNLFLKNEAIEALLKQPEIEAILRDPEIVQDFNNRHYFRLIQHAKIKAVLGNPKFYTQIEKIELESILNHAMKPKTKTSDLSQE